MNDNTNKRIDFVDLTKGICIILVVMAHIDGAFAKFDESSMISCFRMPLYFFISGIFFKSYEGFAGFLIRKINKLLIIFHGHDLIKFNPPIWFLIALFNCNILFYLIHFLRNKHLNLMFASTLLIGAAGFYMGKYRFELPFYMDVAMTALPFYAAGFWIRRYNFFLFPHRFDKWIPLFMAMALTIMYFTATTPGMRTNSYTGNIAQFYIAALAGIFMIMLFCKRIKHISVISYLGRYSVITLGIHGPILHFGGQFVSRYILLYFVIRDPCHLYCIDPIFSKSHAASSSTKRFD